MWYTKTLSQSTNQLERFIKRFRCILTIEMVYVIIYKILLIKSGGGTRPDETRQPDFIQGANSCGFPKDEVK